MTPSKAKASPRRSAGTTVAANPPTATTSNPKPAPRIALAMVSCSRSVSIGGANVAPPRRTRLAARVKRYPTRLITQGAATSVTTAASIMPPAVKPAPTSPKPFATA